MKKSTVWIIVLSCVLLFVFIGYFAWDMNRRLTGQTPAQIESRQRMEEAAQQTQKAYKAKADSFEREMMQHMIEEGYIPDLNKTEMK